MTPSHSGQRDGRGTGTYRLRGDLSTTFAPDRTAVVVIDPVNDFWGEIRLSSADCMGMRSRAASRSACG
jgi:hypothetical protein